MIGIALTVTVGIVISYGIQYFMPEPAALWTAMTLFVFAAAAIAIVIMRGDIKKVKQ